jgi:hypothetical protein
MNDHRITTHFNTTTKASDTLFDGTPENWPIFEHHLLTEAENQTITWNHNITHFQPDNEEKPLNFLERYFNLPEDISLKLELDLANDTIADIAQVNSRLYKLHCLKNQTKELPHPGLGTRHRHIHTSRTSQQRRTSLLCQTCTIHLSGQGSA